MPRTDPTEDLTFQKTKHGCQRTLDYRLKAKENAIGITKHGEMSLETDVITCIQIDFVQNMVAMVTIGRKLLRISLICLLTVSLHGPVRSVGVMVIF